VGIGDVALKAMLDAHLVACIVTGNHRQLQRTLGTLFGPAGPMGRHGPTRPAEGTFGTGSDKRSP